MTCNFVGGAVICTSDSFVNLEPYGAKVWCEYHKWLGPSFYRSKSAIKVIDVPSKKTWAAFDRWFKQSKFYTPPVNELTTSITL